MSRSGQPSWIGMSFGKVLRAMISGRRLCYAENNKIRYDPVEPHYDFTGNRLHKRPSSVSDLSIIPSCQNQKEIMTMSEQAQNGLNYMLNQLDVLQYQIVDSLTQSAEYDRNSRDWTRESIEFLKNTENQLQTFRRAVPFVTNIYWLDNYGKLFTTDSFVNRELFEESQTLYRLEQEAKDACYVPPFTPEYQMEGDNVSVFSYLKNVYRMNRGRERRGVLQIDMRTSYLEELLTLINDNQYCLAYITTEDGSLFWFPDHPYQENGADYDLVYPLNNGWQLRVRYSNAFARRSLKNNLMSSDHSPVYHNTIIHSQRL